MIDNTTFFTAVITFLSTFLGCISSYKLISYRVKKLEEKAERNTNKIDNLNERLLEIEIRKGG